MIQILEYTNIYSLLHLSKEHIFFSGYEETIGSLACSRCDKNRGIKITDTVAKIFGVEAKSRSGKR